MAAQRAHCVRLTVPLSARRTSCVREWVGNTTEQQESMASKADPGFRGPMREEWVPRVLWAEEQAGSMLSWGAGTGPTCQRC